mgnify:CR=1 FL=1
MTVTNEQLQKLPRAARFEIEKLRADVEYYKKQFDEMSGKEPSPVSWHVGYEPRPLPSNAVVTFGNIDVEMDGEGIDILSDGVLTIRASASNRIVVSVQSR